VLFKASKHKKIEQPHKNFKYQPEKRLFDVLPKLPKSLKHKTAIENVS
jgi:hypothetical protein